MAVVRLGEQVSRFAVGFYPTPLTFRLLTILFYYHATQHRHKFAAHRATHRPDTGCSSPGLLARAAPGAPTLRFRGARTRNLPGAFARKQFIAPSCRVLVAFLSMFQPPGPASHTPLGPSAYLLRPLLLPPTASSAFLSIRTVSKSFHAHLF